MVAENQDSMSEHSDSSDASFSDSEKSSGSFAGLVDYWVGFGKSTANQRFEVIEKELKEFKEFKMMNEIRMERLESSAANLVLIEGLRSQNEDLKLKFDRMQLVSELKDERIEEVQSENDKLVSKIDRRDSTIVRRDVSIATLKKDFNLVTEKLEKLEKK